MISKTIGFKGTLFSDTPKLHPLLARRKVEGLARSTATWVTTSHYQLPMEAKVTTNGITMTVDYVVVWHSLATDSHSPKIGGPYVVWTWAAVFCTCEQVPSIANFRCQVFPSVSSGHLKVRSGHQQMVECQNKQSKCRRFHKPTGSTCRFCRLKFQLPVTPCQYWCYHIL